NIGILDTELNKIHDKSCLKLVRSDKKLSIRAIFGSKRYLCICLTISFINGLWRFKNKFYSRCPDHKMKMKVKRHIGLIRHDPEKILHCTLTTNSQSHSCHLILCLSFDALYNFFPFVSNCSFFIIKCSFVFQGQKLSFIHCKDTEQFPTGMLISRHDLPFLSGGSSISLGYRCIKPKKKFMFFEHFKTFPGLSNFTHGHPHHHSSSVKNRINWELLSNVDKISLTPVPNYCLNLPGFYDGKGWDASAWKEIRLTIDMTREAFANL
uniref:Uncharacterized protein n=1 Tax=Echinococcus canadensis TaxID=519352 RepID=A0A915EZ97_9CEST